MLSYNKIFRSGLIKNSVIYALSDGVNRGLNFLVLPFISYYILPEGMGVISNFNVLVQVLTLLSGATVVNALPYIFYKKTKQQLQEYVSNLVFIILALSILFFVLILFLNRIIYRYLELDVDYQLFTLACVFAALITQINMVLWRLENKSVSFAVYQLIQALINIFFVILLVIIFKQDYQGRIWGMIFTAILSTLFSLFYLFKTGFIHFKLNIEYIKEALLFGLPLIPHALSFWFKSGVDKIMITKYIGLSANGIYSMAVTFGGILLMMMTAFFNAYTPHLQKILDSDIGQMPETKNKIVKQSYIIAAVFCCLYFVSVFVAEFCISYLLDPVYAEAAQYVPFIFLSILFQVFYLLIVNYVYNARKNFGLSVITFTISFLQVVLTYFLIKNFGVIGACYASCIGSFLIFILVWFYSNKVYHMPWFYWLHSRK